MNRSNSGFILSCLLCCFYSCSEPVSNKEPATINNSQETAAAAASSKTPSTATTTDHQKILGNWVRYDAPYRLNIEAVSANGTLKAAYLNPRPINISKAHWANVQGVINIYIEMSDVNYPGSHYSLMYYPEQDMLAGKYFQAVEGATYDVGFMRAK